jgi:hypothetical protein
MQILEKVLLGLALVGLFLLLRTFITRMVKSVPSVPAMTAALGPGTQPLALGEGARMAVPSTVGALASEAQSAAQSARAALGDEGTRVILKQTPQTIEVEDASPSVEALKHQEVLKRTTDYIVHKSDNATQILRSWLLDESSEKLGR